VSGPPDPAERSGVRTWRDGPYEISTDRSRLDVGLIHGIVSRELRDSAGIPRDRVERSIEHSLCFGVYEGERQVGFARVVTDRATFAFVSDDFVVESHRGRGLGRWLMRCLLAHPDLQGLRRIVLVTHDPRLYLKAGFAALQEPATYLAIEAPDAYAGGRQSTDPLRSRIAIEK
jgi:GNAT superfamily N-acetyltransferase